LIYRQTSSKTNIRAIPAVTKILEKKEGKKRLMGGGLKRLLYKIEVLIQV